MPQGVLAPPPGFVPLNPGETLGPPTPDPFAAIAHKAAPPAKRGKAILERNTCDDLVVYDRDKYAGGDPLVRYWGPNENFVLVRAESSSKLQSDRSDQFIEGSCDRLVEFVDLI